MSDIILNSLIEAIRQKDYQDAEHYAYRFYEKYETISDLLDEAIEERDYFREKKIELRRDKERLDWLIKNGSAYWVYTREDIDKKMEESQ